TLTKGPVGFVVPLIAASLYLTWTRRWRDYWQTGLPLLGTLVFLLLALPWYVAMFMVHGEAYASGPKPHPIGRFLNPMEGHSFTIFFYVPVLLLGFFPWSGLLLVALYQMLKRWREARGTPPSRPSPLAPRPPAPEELEWFAALWVIGVFVFFTLS